MITSTENLNILTPAGSHAKIILYEDGSFRFLELPSKHRVRWAAWKPGDNYAILVGNHGTILELKDESFTMLDSGDVVDNLRCVSFSRHGDAMIVGNNGRILRLEGERVREIPVGSGDNVRRTSFSPGGERCMMVGNGGLCLEYMDGSLNTITGAENNLRSVSWHPSGRSALISGNAYRPSSAGLIPSPNLYIYHEGTSELEPLSGMEKVDIIGVEWDPNGETALAVGYDLVLHRSVVMSYTDGEITVLPLDEERLFPTGISWSPRGNFAFIVTGGPQSGVGVGRVIKYRDSGFNNLFSAGDYHLDGVSWESSGKRAAIFGSTSSKIFTV